MAEQTLDVEKVVALLNALADESCGLTYQGAALDEPLRALASALPGLVQRDTERRDLALRAFVKGAKWWEFEKEGATMWPADQRKAYYAAVERYDRDPANAFLSPLEIAERAEAAAASHLERRPNG